MHKDSLREFLIKVWTNSGEKLLMNAGLACKMKTGYTRFCPLFVNEAQYEENLTQTLGSQL